MVKLIRMLGLAALVPLFSSCGTSLSLRTVGGVDLMNAEHVYTLVNLHPDETHKRLYAANFQFPGLIPMCTEVKLDKIKRKALVFTVKSDGRKYTYRYHKFAAEPLVNHLQRYFGTTSCDQDRVASLSEVDQKGVRVGTALVGMSRQGVIYALGYPPRHVTRDPENSDDWKYWHDRSHTFIVHFEGGLVAAIRE